MSSVVVIDYGMGNLHSIAKALQHADSGVNVQISAYPKTIAAADRVVFPGVGAMRDCMQALHETGLAEVIKQVANSKPLLGICLGMQALLTDSEEGGKIDCLNLFPGHVRRFADDLTDSNGERLKIPHMGWNQVQQLPHPLWQSIPQNSRFYFVTAILPRLIINKIALPPAITRSRLPAPWLKTMYLPCNFILKKAKRLVCNCYRISCAGMALIKPCRHRLLTKCTDLTAEI